MTQHFERFIPLYGCFNFRDLGGYQTADGRTVRSGFLFRSDALHRMTAADADFVTGSLGVASIIDLRNPEESKRDGWGILAQSPVRYHNIPLLGERGLASPNSPNSKEDQGERLREIYTWILDNAGGLIGQAVNTVAEDETLPAVFHCTAGKDRTGILAAFLLGVLGVSDQDIVADYILTNQVLDKIIERLRQVPGYADRPREFFEIKAEFMQTVVDRVTQSHGGFEGYVTSHGVSPATVSQLRDKLLE